MKNKNFAVLEELCCLQEAFYIKRSKYLYKLYILILFYGPLGHNLLKLLVQKCSHSELHLEIIELKNSIIL